MESELLFDAMRHGKSQIQHIFMECNDVVKLNWIDPTLCPTQQKCTLLFVKNTPFWALFIDGSCIIVCPSLPTYESMHRHPNSTFMANKLYFSDESNSKSNISYFCFVYKDEFS